MKPEHKIMFREFMAKGFERLEKGGAEYRNKNLECGIDEGLDLTAMEIIEEAEDVCGWSFILWMKLRNLLAEVEMLEPRVRELRLDEERLERRVDDLRAKITGKD